MEFLETNKYRLEIINEDHYDYLKKYALEKDLWRYSTIKIENEDDFQKYFNQALLMTTQTTQRVYVIFDLIKKSYVGMTRLYAFDSKNKSAKVGFTWYTKSSQGSGINIHSKYLMLRKAFQSLNLERIELNADSRNERSIGAMMKIGFVKEGVLRESIYLPDGHKRDTVIFSILKNEWKSTMNLYLESNL